MLPYDWGTPKLFEILDALTPFQGLRTVPNVIMLHTSTYAENFSLARIHALNCERHSYQRDLSVSLLSVQPNQGLLRRLRRLTPVRRGNDGETT